jgi:hypothetical protein
MTVNDVVEHPVSPTLISPSEIEERPWQPVAGSPGVSAKVL